jgi:hypothetical protein
VAYVLQFQETTVAPYLLDLELSREGRLALASVLDQVRLYADDFIRDKQRRLSPGSDCFRVDWLFRDPISEVIHHLKLVISDTAAAYGILCVVYVEDEPGARWP